MQCLDCGTDNRPGAHFCKQCSTELSQSPQSSPIVPPEEGAVAPNEVAAAPRRTSPSFAQSDQFPEDEAALPDTEADPSHAAVYNVVRETIPAPQTLTPLAPGTLISDRFEIEAILESSHEGVNLYSALDRTTCPDCGVENQIDTNFCAECGRELNADSRLRCKLHEAGAPEILAVGPDDIFSFKERFYCAISSVVDETTLSPDKSGSKTVALTVGYNTDTGQVRDLNEDSLFVFYLSSVHESVADPTLGLFAVADGMGGHEGGEVASRQTIKLIAEELTQEILFPCAFKSSIQADWEGEKAVHAQIVATVNRANESLYHVGQEQANDMGCTLTMMLVVDHTAFVANVGDSRTYLWREGELRQITTDHSLITSLIAAGTVQPEAIYTHPDRHVVYRSMGNKPSVEVDVWQEPLQPGDNLLLCSDGLWESVRDEGIQEVLLTYFEPQMACNEMVRRANLAGGEDNISVILVKVGPYPSGPTIALKKSMIH